MAKVIFYLEPSGTHDIRIAMISYRCIDQYKNGALPLRHRFIWIKILLNTLHNRSWKISFCQVTVEGGQDESSLRFSSDIIHNPSIRYLPMESIPSPCIRHATSLGQICDDEAVICVILRCKLASSPALRMRYPTTTVPTRPGPITRRPGPITRSPVRLLEDAKYMVG